MRFAPGLAGAAAAGLSRDRMQGIALATRQPKDETVGGSDWRDAARARGAEHGFGRADIGALAARVLRKGVGPDLDRPWSRLSGPSGLTEMHNTFARRHALAEIAGGFPDGATMPELEDATNNYLADLSVRALSAAEGEARFTSESLLACERASERSSTAPSAAARRESGSSHPTSSRA